MPKSSRTARTLPNVATARALINVTKSSRTAGTVTNAAISQTAVKLLADIVGPLAAALGPNSEVVLHDLEALPNSIVSIAGGITGRKVGGPATDLLLRHITEGRREHLLRYRTVTRNGRILCSSTIFIRNKQGRPVACLCINTDVTQLTHAHDILGEFLTASQDPPESPLHGGREHGADEHFPLTVEELAASTVQTVIERMDVPVQLMQKRHKVEVVRQLDALGLFLVRNSVDFVAEALEVTRFTIYNYLAELAESSVVSGLGSTARAPARRLPLRLNNAHAKGRTRQ